MCTVNWVFGSAHRWCHGAGQAGGPEEEQGRHPEEYREALGIREGDEVELRLEGGGILIRPVWLVENPMERLSGL